MSKTLTDMESHFVTLKSTTVGKERKVQMHNFALLPKNT